MISLCNIFFFQVRPIGVQSVLLRNPYILFYELIKRAPVAKNKDINLIRAGSMNGKSDGNKSGMMNGRCEEKQSISSLGVTLNRVNSLGKVVSQHKPALTNGTSDSDLGEVVVRAKAPNAIPLPPPKERSVIAYNYVQILL